MFIHGGLNQKNNFLDDAAVLNVEKCRWKCLNIHGTAPGLIGFHTAVTVLNPEQRNTNTIYKIANVRHGIVKYPGIYVFGGLNQNRQAQNGLFVLDIGSRTMS